MSGASTSTRPRGWFGSRWGRLLSLAIAIALGVFGWSATWFSVSTSGTDADGRLAGQGAELVLKAADATPWGPIFAVGIILAVVLAGSALVWPRVDVARWLAIGSVAAAMVAGAAAALGFRRAVAAYEAEAGDLREAARLYFELTGDDLPAFYTSTFGGDGVWLGILAALVLGLVAIRTAWPAHDVKIMAGTVTAVMLLTLAVPWLLVEQFDGAAVSIEPVTWTRIGGRAVLAVATAAVLLVLVWLSVLRRSNVAGLPLMLFTVVWGIGSFIFENTIEVQPSGWMPEAELRSHDLVDLLARLPSEFIFSVLQIVLVVVAVLAWRRNRARARPAAPVATPREADRTVVGHP
jgi:hypothetical protein